LRFDLGAVKAHLRYGSYRLGDTLFNSVQSQADLLIGGVVAGATAMGFYTLPRGLALQLANTVVNPVVTRVGLPVMAKVQGDKAALKSIYLQTLRMTSSINFPIYAGLAIWAPEVVAILFGSQWHEAGAYLRLFAAWGLIRSTGNPVGSLVYATGHVRRAFWWNLAQLLVVPGLLWLGVMLAGSYGLATAMLCVQMLALYPLFRTLVQPACGARFHEYIGALLPALVASAFAGTVGIAASSLFPQSVWTRVLSGGVAAAVAYVAASWVVNRIWVLALMELLNPGFKAKPMVKAPVVSE
jgi:O-antigen/teichoic acid export membrane protein